MRGATLVCYYGWSERTTRCCGCFEPQPLSEIDAEDAGLTVAGWTEDPRPFIWEGPRRDRRGRARQRHLSGAAAVVDPSQPIAT